jgi:alcohol dehydrogenase class IV
MPLLNWKEPRLLRGPGSIEELPGLIEALGLKRVLLVTDANLMRLRLPDGLLSAPERGGVACTVYDRTESNPLYPVPRIMRRAGCEEVIRKLMM